MEIGFHTITYRLASGKKRPDPDIKEKLWDEVYITADLENPPGSRDSYSRWDVYVENPMTANLAPPNSSFSPGWERLKLEVFPSDDGSVNRDAAEIRIFDPTKGPVSRWVTVQNPGSEFDANIACKYGFSAASEVKAAISTSLDIYINWIKSLPVIS